MEEVSMYASQGASTVSTMISLAISILMIIAWWKIFEKAGEAGWKAIIPILNVYVLFKIAWGSGWKFLLLIIPLVNIIILFIVFWKLARAFGQSTGMCVLMLFLSNIVMLILAFGSAEYIGPQ